MSEPMTREKFRERFTVLHGLVAMTDRELANTLGVSFPTIERYLSGDTCPAARHGRPMYLRKLIRVLNDEWGVSR
jgi:transposase